MPGMSSLGDLGGGSALGGLSGFGQQIADLIGGLFGAGDGSPSERSDVGGPAELEDLDGSVDDDLPEDDTDDEAEDDPEDVSEAEEAEKEDEAEDPALEDAPDDAQEPTAEPTTGATGSGPEPEPAATPPPLTPPPPAEVPGAVAVPDSVAVPESVAGTAEPTPCEIAAEELPQVGE